MFFKWYILDSWIIVSVFYDIRNIKGIYISRSKIIVFIYCLKLYIYNVSCFMLFNDFDLGLIKEGWKLWFWWKLLFV